MKTNQPTGRQNCQITPFTYGNHAVRAVVIENEPWFIVKDVSDVLGLGNPRETLRDFPENEKGVSKVDTLGGKQEMLTVNEPGLYRLIFQSRKPEAERFKAWVFADVLPVIRKTGSYGSTEHEDEACAGKIYRLFSNCHDMTIQRINKVIYYFALDPPLSNTDIAKLLCVSDSIITHWRKRLAPEMARKAVTALGLNAQGSTASKVAMLPMREARPGFPLYLPAKEAQDEQIQ